MAKQNTKKRKPSSYKSNPYFKKGFKQGARPDLSAALMGNQFWKRRSKHGRDKILNDPKILAEESEKYFQWEDENVFQKQELYKGKIVYLPQPPLYTIQSLAIYLGVGSSYLINFVGNLKEEDPKRKDFLLVFEWIADTIYQSKLSGAMHGAFNANLVGYDLKIRQDVTQVTASATSAPQIIVQDEKDKERMKLVKQKLNELDKKKK